MRLLFLLLPLWLCAEDIRIRCLLESYPEAIASIADNRVTMKSGESFVFEDGVEKNSSELLAHPDIADMFTHTYPLEYPTAHPRGDPGRIRHQGFFKALYGASPEQITPQLITLESAGFHTSIAPRIATLLPILPKDALPLGGGYRWRVIAGTERLSMHSFGIAIDLNPAHARYWFWDVRDFGAMRYAPTLSPDLVSAFEAQGFIWGGKWHHYDSMHFEYRPEILCAARHTQK